MTPGVISVFVDDHGTPVSLKAVHGHLRVELPNGGFRRHVLKGAGEFVLQTKAPAPPKGARLEVELLFPGIGGGKVVGVGQAK